MQILRYKQNGNEIETVTARGLTHICGAGYGKLFIRHRGCQKYDKPVTYFGKSHRGVMIMGLIVKQERDKTEQEKLEELMG